LAYQSIQITYSTTSLAGKVPGRKIPDLDYTNTGIFSSISFKISSTSASVGAITNLILYGLKSGKPLK
jgi:hypothetical protein